ncbi:hypothetical protein K8I61_17810 [bacterium]|nr:hypothetical protein [bacterium]
MKTTIILTAALVALAFAGLAHAEDADVEDPGVSVDLSGYYRVRYDNIFNHGFRFDDEEILGDDTDVDSDWWSFFDQRALFLPTVTVNEKIQLKAQVDALRNSMFGQNATARVPFVRVQRNPSDVEEIETVELDTDGLVRGNALSQDTSTTQSYYSTTPGAEVDPIQLTRLWAEVLLPVGFVRFGRMPSQFGMGVFSNSGLPEKTEYGWEGLDKNYGDTYDRLMFGTKIGPYVPVLIYDRIVENDFRTGDQDVHELAFVQYVRDVKLGTNSTFNGGLYFVNRNQHSTNARLNAYDLWLKFKFGGFEIENEGVWLQGSFKQIDFETIEDLEESGLPTGAGAGKIAVSAFVDALRFRYRSAKWGAGLMGGFSSPEHPDPEREFDGDAAREVALAALSRDADEDASENTIDFIEAVVENQRAFGDRINTFPMDRDFNVDMIVWEILMGGAVKNGIFAKAGGYLRPVEQMTINVDLIKSWINEPHKDKDGGDASHDLGWELNVGVEGFFWGHFFTGLDIGYAWVGPYFSDVYDNVSNVTMARMRTGITF